MAFVTVFTTLSMFATLIMTSVPPDLVADLPTETNELRLERYPTQAEIASLLVELRQKIPALEASGFYSDRRSADERAQVETLIAEWMERDAAIAPFLGDWVAIEENLAIFPTATPGQVCIIDTYLDDSAFYQGHVRNGRLYTDINLVFALDSGFLGSFAVYEGQAHLYEYRHPRPLLDPSTTPWLRDQHPDVVAQFQAAGCLTAKF